MYVCPDLTRKMYVIIWLSQNYICVFSRNMGTIQCNLYICMMYMNLCMHIHTQYTPTCTHTTHIHIQTQHKYIYMHIHTHIHIKFELFGIFEKMKDQYVT